jgi:hypothetical protein
VYYGDAIALDNILAIVDGTKEGPFKSRSATFTVSPDETFALPTSAPTSPSGSTPTQAPTLTALPTSTDVDVLVVINLDIFEFETGFRIETAAGEPIYEESPGTYNNELTTSLSSWIATETDLAQMLLSTLARCKIRTCCWRNSNILRVIASRSNGAAHSGLPSVHLRIQPAMFVDRTLR